MTPRWRALGVLLPGLLLVLALPRAGSAQIYTRLNRNGVIEATNVPDSADFRLTYPGKGTLIHSRGFRRTIYRGEFDQHIQAAAAAFNVSIDLVKAVIEVESEFDRLAVSSKGAQGLMQLMPFTARRFGVSDPFDPRQNVFAGVQYLRFLLDLFRGDVSLALAGYNAGENAVLRHGGVPPYKETRNYVQKIRAILGSDGFVPFAATPILAYAPSAARLQTPVRSARIVPARPRVYYKFVDTGGLLHVSQDPPADGVSYTMLRAMD